jgi:hypothetical protein
VIGASEPVSPEWESLFPVQIVPAQVHDAASNLNQCVKNPGCMALAVFPCRTVISASCFTLTLGQKMPAVGRGGQNSTSRPLLFGIKADIRKRSWLLKSFFAFTFMSSRN